MRKLLSALMIAAALCSGGVSAQTNPFEIAPANSMPGNWGAAAAPILNKTMPTCADSGGNHLNYVNGTGITCGTSSSAVNTVSLISTQTASSSTDLSWTGLGTSYNTYLLQCNGIIFSGNIAYYFQFGEGGSPTWKTSGYNTQSSTVDQSGTQNLYGATNDSGIEPTGTRTGSASGNAYTLTAWISNIGSGSLNKSMTGTFESINSQNSSPYAAGTFGGVYTTDTTAVTAIRLHAGSGSFTSGQCSLYSLSN